MEEGLRCPGVTAVLGETQAADPTAGRRLSLALALSYGLVLSFGALLAEEHAFRRYRRWRCLARLAGAAVFENFGYRQFLSLVRVWSIVTLARRRGRRTWGRMCRVGFASDRWGAGRQPWLRARPSSLSA